MLCDSLILNNKYDSNGIKMRFTCPIYSNVVSLLFNFEFAKNFRSRAVCEGYVGTILKDTDDLRRTFSATRARVLQN